MYYLYSSLLSSHWETIRQVVQTHYYDEEEHKDDLFIIGLCAMTPIEYLVDFAKNHYSRDFKKVIIYQLEPLVESHWHKPEKILRHITSEKYNCEIWDYDIDNIQYLRERGIEAKFKPMKLCQSLKTIQNSEDPKIDLLFYGSYTQHRADLIVDFQRNIVLQDSQKRLEIYSKANFVWLFNIDGKDLEKYIADSKIILNLAPYPNSLQQQTRIFHALNNNKCILSEKVKRNYFSNQIVEFEGVQELYTKTVDLLSDDNWKNYTNHI